MAVPVLAGIAAAGAIASVYGQISSANAQEEASRKNLELKRAQADQLEKWGKREEEVFRKRLDKASSDYRGGMARQGGMTNAGIRELEDLYHSAELEVLDIREKVRFNAQQLRSGADIEAGLIDSLSTAKWWEAGGTLLTRGAQIGGLFTGSTETGIGKSPRGAKLLPAER